MSGFIKFDGKVYDYGYFCEYIKRRLIIEMADEFRNSKVEVENDSNM